MPNPKGYASSLKPADSPWLHKPTKTIRVPVQFADKILGYAHEVDEGKVENLENIEEIADKIDQAMQCIEDACEGTSQRFTIARQRKLAEAEEILETIVTALRQIKASRN